MQVTGRNVSYEADQAGFSVMPEVTAFLASPPTIPRDGLCLNLAFPAVVVAGHGMPLVGEGSVQVQLGRVPDGLYTKLKNKAEEEAKKKKEPPENEPPIEKPSKEEPPKEDKNPKIIKIKAFSVNLNKEPDFLSDPVRVLNRNREVELLEERGFWRKVRDVSSSDEGWVHRSGTVERGPYWSKMDQLRGSPHTEDGFDNTAGRG